MLTESDELSVVIKEDGSGGLLIIRVIAWIEDLNSVFLTRFDDSWSNTVPKIELGSNLKGF